MRENPTCPYCGHEEDLSGFDFEGGRPFIGGLEYQYEPDSSIIFTCDNCVEDYKLWFTEQGFTTQGCL